MTPIEKYARCARSADAPALAGFWPHALPTGRKAYVAERRGLRVDNVWRGGTGLVIGRRYEVRVLPGHDPVYLAGTTDGRFLCPLRIGETEEERNARLAENARRTRYLSRLARQSERSTHQVATSPGTGAYQSSGEERRVEEATRPTLASVDAARGLPGPGEAA